MISYRKKNTFETNMHQTILKILLSIILLILSFFYCSNLLLNAIKCHGYSIGDWLINFQGGFVRRGLGGEIFLYFSDLVKIKPNYLVWIVQVILIVLIYCILIKIIWKKELNIWFVMLCFTPYGLLFTFFDIGIVGRKEIILFAAFAVFIWTLINENFNQDKLIKWYCILLTFSTFIHELIFFYTPYFVLALFASNKLRNLKFNPKSLYLILLPLIATVVIYLKGSNFNGDLNCEKLMTYGLEPQVCKGILAWPNSFGAKEVLNYAINNNYFWNYGLSLILSLKLIFFFIHYSNFRFITIKNFFSLFVVVFLFTLPLFIKAIDWGRWINIHFILILFLFSLFMNDQDNNPVNSFRKFLEIKFKTNVNFKLSMNLLAIIFSVFYLRFIFMRHFGTFDVMSSEIKNFNIEGNWKSLITVLNIIRNY